MSAFTESQCPHDVTLVLPPGLWYCTSLSAVLYTCSYTQYTQVIKYLPEEKAFISEWVWVKCVTGGCYLSPCRWQRPGPLPLPGLCSPPRWRYTRSGWKPATGRWRRQPPPSGSGWRRAPAGPGPRLGRWGGGTAASRSPAEPRGRGALRAKEEEEGPQVIVTQQVSAAARPKLVPSVESFSLELALPTCAKFTQQLSRETLRLLVLN